LRLIEQHSTDWRSRAHFFGLVAEMMRRILVNHALGRNSLKRFGSQTRISLDECISFAKERELDVIVLDEALDKLAGFDRAQARIIELKFFAGLTNEEIAEVTGVSDSTVKREWRIAKAWLHNEMKTLE